MKNDNGKIIKKLSGRSLKKNRLRNLFAVIAIALTSMLFTTVFSMGAGMMQVAQEQTMRQVGMRSHGALKAATREQMERIVKSPQVKKYSYNIFIGIAENIRKRQAEIRFTPDEKELDNSFIKLAEGRMPEAKDEIIVDTQILDEQKKPHKTGEQVTLTFLFQGQERSSTFKVCGWYETDYVGLASQLYVSESFWDSLRGDKTDEDFKAWGEEHQEDKAVGLYTVGLTFADSVNIEEKVRNAIREAGYEPETEVEYGVNWAYMSNRMESVDTTSLLILGSAFAVILVTGYLIIYNIFYISIMRDIRFYGLLKTIGTTKQQIKRLIRRQAVRLSVIGIPIGLALGFGVGKVLFPFVTRMNEYQGMHISLKFSPYIILFGAVFSFLTVFFSCRKPGAIAGGVSPVEAVNYADVSVSKRKKKKSDKGARLSRMALSNLGRNKKKTVLVILSMSLSIILLTVVLTAVKSFRIESYLESRIVGDYVIGNVDFISTQGYDFKIDDSYLEGTDARQGIEDREEIWRGEADCVLNEEAGKNYLEMDKKGILFPVNGRGITPKQVVEQNSPLSVEYYGYSAGLMTNLKVLQGTLDTGKFENGKYVLVTQVSGEKTAPITEELYAPGDKLQLQMRTADSEYIPAFAEDGEEVQGSWSDTVTEEYEVMAIIEIPGSMEKNGNSPNGFKAVLPLEQLQEGGGGNQRIAVSYRVSEKNKDAFEAFLKDYTENINTDMGYLSKGILVKEFSVLTNTVKVAGGALCGVIALIGILNFINAILTGIISRQREFAVMKSVGMTKGQQNKMLIFEGVYYGLFSGILGIAVGVPLTKIVIEAFKNFILFFEYRFTPMSFLIMIPVFLAIGVLVPWIAYKKAGTKSIVEQLKDAE